MKTSPCWLQVYIPSESQPGQPLSPRLPCSLPPVLTSHTCSHNPIMSSEVTGFCNRFNSDHKSNSSLTFLVQPLIDFFWLHLRVSGFIVSIKTSIYWDKRTLWFFKNTVLPIWLYIRIKLSERQVTHRKWLTSGSDEIKSIHTAFFRDAEAVIRGQ